MDEIRRYGNSKRCADVVVQVGLGKACKLEMVVTAATLEA